jgi:hypothetical protein
MLTIEEMEIAESHDAAAELPGKQEVRRRNGRATRG